MTRINVGIPVAKLPRDLLLAEHREIKRIPNHLAKHGFNRKMLPAKFKLGPGHVIFMMSKGVYTHNRYQELYDECIARGYKVQNYDDAWMIYMEYPELYENFEPTVEDVTLILNRIKDRGISLYS